MPIAEPIAHQLANSGVDSDAVRGPAPDAPHVQYARSHTLTRTDTHTNAPHRQSAGIPMRPRAASVARRQLGSPCKTVTHLSIQPREIPFFFHPHPLSKRFTFVQITLCSTLAAAAGNLPPKDPGGRVPARKSRPRYHHVRSARRTESCVAGARVSAPNAGGVFGQLHSPTGAHSGPIIIYFTPAVGPPHHDPCGASNRTVASSQRLRRLEDPKAPIGLVVRQAAPRAPSSRAAPPWHAPSNLSTNI